MDKDDITIMGYTTFRDEKKTFGIKVEDRRRHIYIIGKTGSGKSNLMENMLIDDIRQGKGVGLIDPHGDFAEKLLDFVPESRIDDVVYFNPSDTAYPIAFNPLEQVTDEHRHLIASGIMGVFAKIWVDMWSARMEYILNNALLALLEYPNATILGVMRLLTDKDYRKKVVDNLSDPVVKNYWAKEFASYDQRYAVEATASILNKIGQFVSNPLIRNIVGQPKSAINLRRIMDDGKIFIANLSKGKMGEDNSALLGGMLVTRFQQAAMSRVDIPNEDDRKDFYLSIDEFQNFSTDSFASILSEARKYHFSLTLAHQYIAQLAKDKNTTVRDAIFGNVGTFVVFRVGPEDSEFLEKEFTPRFEASDLVNLPKFHTYTKLMIDGVASKPFSATTFPPQKTPENSFADVIIENNRRKYAIPKESADEKIRKEWDLGSENVAAGKVEKKNEKGLEILTPKSQVKKKTYNIDKDKLKKALEMGQSSSDPDSSISNTDPTPTPPKVDDDIDLKKIARYNRPLLDPKEFIEQNHVLLSSRKALGENWINTEEWLLRTDELIDVIIESSKQKGIHLSRHPDELEKIVFMVGSFVGETLKEIFGGKWAWNDTLKRWVVVFTNVKGEPVDINVFRKVENRFINGMEDSITYYYQMAKKLRAGEIFGN